MQFNTLVSTQEWSQSKEDRKYLLTTCNFGIWILLQMGVQNGIAYLVTDFVWKTKTITWVNGNINYITGSKRKMPHVGANCPPSYSRGRTGVSAVAISACAHVVSKRARATPRRPEGKHGTLINELTTYRQTDKMHSPSSSSSSGMKTTVLGVTYTNSRVLHE